MQVRKFVIERNLLQIIIRNAMKKCGYVKKMWIYIQHFYILEEVYECDLKLLRNRVLQKYLVTC